MPLHFPLHSLALLPVAALALGASAPAASACPMQHAASPATLTVQGEGRAAAQPDIATVTLGVTVQAPSASEAMAQNAAKQQAVIDALKTQGVQPRDIQTSGLNLSPTQDYSREGKPPVITGYQAQNMVTVTVRDLSRLGSALDGLISAGANEVNGIAFSRDDQQSAEDQARADAVKNARHRAEILAQAAGLELGGVLSMSDSGGDSGPMPIMAMARDKAGASTPIEAGELSVTARVSATFVLVDDGSTGGAMNSCGMDGHMKRGGDSRHGHWHGHGHGHDGWQTRRGHAAALPHDAGRPRDSVADGMTGLPNDPAVPPPPPAGTPPAPADAAPVAPQPSTQGAAGN